MDDLGVWQRRWEALNENIEYVESNIQDSISRSSTIRYLLKNLRFFGRDHFNYFYRGFKTGSPKLNYKIVFEEMEYDYPKEAVLRAIIDQISFDLELINRVLNQRTIKKGARPQNERSKYEFKWHNTLKKADLLGQLALMPAIDANLIDENVTVITYFQKATTVRIIPYAKVAIIGLPFTAVDIPQDLLAIPHEVAHYIFRHGTLKDGKSVSYELKQKNKSRNLYLQNWLEEMFADIYGCLVAGPVIALDFQDLQLDDPLEEFFDANKDKEDPVPIVRPDIYNKILALRTNSKAGIDELIKNHWNQRRDAYMNRVSVNMVNAITSNAPLPDNNSGRENVFANDLDFKTGNTRLKIEDVRGDGNDLATGNQLDNMIRSLKNTAFEDLLLQINNNTNSYFDWSGNLANITKDNLEEMYIGFEKVTEAKLANIGDETILAAPENLPENSILYQDGAVEGVSKLWINYVKGWVIRNDFSEIINVQNDLFQTERSPIEKNEKTWGWLKLAIADGWVTRGPEPNPIGPPGAG